MADDPQTTPDIPGSPRHQRLLRGMTAYLARQPWALAFAAFGSVARGDWDQYSDLDLDVVIADGVSIAPVEEVQRLCAAIGVEAALIAPRRGDDADVVLRSLEQFSIRYHPLRATSPNILDSLRVLWTRIDEARIHAAGRANAHSDEPGNDALLALCVREMLEGAHALARERPWAALAALESYRNLMMTLYARAHVGERPLRTFERHADEALQADLRRTLAQGDPASIRDALLAACDLLQQQLAAFTDSETRLTDGERDALASVAAKLHNETRRR